MICKASSAVSAVMQIVGTVNGTRDVYVILQEFSLRFFPQKNKKWHFFLAGAIRVEALKYPFTP